ncbi:MAG: hypothetical protein WBW33_37845 [Bryobacteraceae bacterium]
MSEMHPPRRVGRSIAALLAGFVVVVVLSVGTDTALRAADVLPPLGQLLLLMTAYRVVFGVLGSYISAVLAPYRPMLHALAGGALGLVLSIVGAVVTWNNGPGFGPHWYPVLLIVLALPQSWLGGKLREMQLRTRPA